MSGAEMLDLAAGCFRCGSDLAEARQLLAVALIDVAETLLELGQPLPVPNPQLSDVEMDVVEPIYLHLRASSAVAAILPSPARKVSGVTT